MSLESLARPVSVESMRFSSADIAPTERLAAYRRFNGTASEASQIGPEFAVTLNRWRFDRIVLHERSAHDVRHTRTDAHLSDGIDHFVLHLVLSGNYQADIGAGFHAVPHGSILVLDMGRPMQTSAQDARIITVSLARKLLSDGESVIEGLHGLVLAEAHALPLADFLVSLSARAASLPAGVAVGVSQAIVTLAAVALGPHVAGEMRDSDSGLLDRARRLIELELHDPAIGAEDIAAQIGLSRASLYRLFKPHGGLMAYIRGRRLDRVRVALSDPREARSLQHICSEAGFISESHCSRMFMAAYGLRPSAYRGRQARLQDGRSGDARLQHWMSELR